MKTRIQKYRWDDNQSLVSHYKVPGKPHQLIPQKWYPWIRHNLPVEILEGPVNEFLDYMVQLIDHSDGHEKQEADEFLKHMMIYAGNVYFTEYLKEHELENVPYLLWKHFIKDGDWYQLTVPAYRTVPLDHLIRFLKEGKVDGLNYKDVAKVLSTREDRIFQMPVETIISIWF